MLFKVTVLTFLGLVLAFPEDSYGPQAKEYQSQPMPYNFAYGVKDEYAGANYGHNEDSDGQSVKGSYTVQLPDGRIQTVEYVADHFNGFQAKVSYQGEAQYPHEYGPAITFKPQTYKAPNTYN
ncbi:cuticle protein 18.6-like [Macrobrachium rosenbergii]|uniref:cuticle protein 18.6-like n=1 Tax=Macrobrachium rosenbergii TaxID=79674 RepID=UPI0034D5C02E